MSTVTDIKSRLDKRKIKIAARGAQEQRRFRRVQLSIPGRYLDPVRGEFACKLVDVSPGGARISAEVPPPVNDHIVMLFEGLGRLEGDVVRAGRAGFAVRFSFSDRKRDRLADAITWQFNMARPARTTSPSSRPRPSNNMTI